MLPKLPLVFEVDRQSCEVHIAATGVTINGTRIHEAGPVAMFHKILGEPTRVVAAGPPAPASHRNNHIHYYDQLGVTLNEHHYTYQIQGITFVFDTVDAIHPTKCVFSGTLDLGGTQVVAGDFESVLAKSQIPFAAQLKGTWTAKVASAAENGRPITIHIDSAGRRLPSGRRSKSRRILTISLGLEHDPWDQRFRPERE